MLKGNGRIGAQSMPTSEDLAKWGAYELSFEELLEVNGGKRDRSEGRSGGGRSSGSGGSSSKGSSGGESNKSSGGGVKSKETNKDKSKGSKTHTGSTGTEGKKNGVGGTTGNGLKGGEPKSKEEKKMGSTDYTVREGDTLSGIVRERYPGASKEEIAEKVKEVAKNSGIKDIDVIHPGDKIIFEKATEPSSEAGSAEANTGKEKGSAGGTTREGRGSTGSGFLRGGGYRQGVEKSTAGGQGLSKNKALSGIQQKVSIQGTMYKEARLKISGFFDRIGNTFRNTNKGNTESYLGKRRGWGKKKEEIAPERIPETVTPSGSIEYTFQQGYSQLDFDKRYGFVPNPKDGKTVSCKTLSLVNSTISKEVLGEQKFYEVLDNAVKTWKDNGWICSDGSPKNIEAMSNSLSKEVEEKTFQGMVYPNAPKSWTTQRMNPDVFFQSNYTEGIGKWIADDKTHYMSVSKRRGGITVTDSMDINRASASSYILESVEPFTERKVY